MVKGGHPLLFTKGMEVFYSLKDFSLIQVSHFFQVGLLRVAALMVVAEKGSCAGITVRFQGSVTLPDTPRMNSTSLQKPARIYTYRGSRGHW